MYIDFFLPKSKISGNEDDYKINSKISVLVEQVDTELQKIILSSKNKSLDSLDNDNANTDSELSNEEESNNSDEIINSKDGVMDDDTSNDGELEIKDNESEEESFSNETSSSRGLKEICITQSAIIALGICPS